MQLFPMMMVNTLVIMSSRSMELEDMNGKTDVHTKENGMKTWLMEWEHMFGQMADSIKVNGSRIVCKGWGCINGLMVGYTWENIRIIIRMVLEFTNLPKTNIILDNGKMEKGMGLELFKAEINQNMVSGKKENKFSGLMKKKLEILKKASVTLECIFRNQKINKLNSLKVIFKSPNHLIKN